MPLGDAPRLPQGTLLDGVSGLYGTLGQDAYETTPALTYPLSIQTYMKMRRDPQIKAVLDSYTLPLTNATWAINSKGCRDEVVQLVADAWGLPVAGDGDNDDGPGPARRRGVQWDDYLRVALLMLPFGHSPFVQWYDIGGTPLRARLAGLEERLPWTISDIKVDPQGHLEGIYQNGSRQLIPAKSLVWNVHRREGASWQGNSMIREAYGPWLLKHEMWRALGAGNRRFSMGVPNVKTGPNPTPADVQQAAMIAAGYRGGDQAGVGLPQGWAFELAGMTGSAPDTLGFVRYLDQQIATSCLATVLNLDTSPNGSRALGETMIGLLQLSWGAVSKEIMAPANRLNVQMVDLNFGEDEPVPGLLCTDLSRPELTSDAVKALVDCGALTADLSLESYLRMRYHLPVISQEDFEHAHEDPAQDPATALDPAPVNPRDPEPAV